MLTEDLAARFKDPRDRLRLVFVCAMWMTGFDAPAVSTIYLDRPMRNHTLMQTIARANRVFPDKDNGLIVDYVGVFRNLEAALAIYGAGDPEPGSDSPIEYVAALAEALARAVNDVIHFCGDAGVDLSALRDATGFEHIALRDAAVEKLLAGEDVRTGFMDRARTVRRLFKAVLLDPKAAEDQLTVAAITVVAERIAAVTREPGADIDAVADAVDALLDRSVGAEEYVIRAAADGAQADPLIDLSQIDFEGLAARLAGRKRAETDRLAQLLKQRASAAARRNPTRYDLVERVEALIADYNAGSLNIDEYLRRLIELSATLTDEEQRAVREDLTEEELAIVDLLTKPDPVLSADELAGVKASAKRLLEHLHDKLVLDWRRKADTTADVLVTIRRSLDADLPADPYPPEVFDAKVQRVYDHVLAAYQDDGTSAYSEAAAAGGPSTGSMKQGAPDAPGTAPSEATPPRPLDVDTITDTVITRLRADPTFAARVAAELRGSGGSNSRV